jgi:hypothetical protein
MHSTHALSLVFTPLLQGADAAPADADRPPARPYTEARNQQADLAVRLRHAQSAFSESLGRYIEL